MEQFHGTTIVSARRGARVALGGDGQVTLGNIVVKASARKVRRLYHDKILAGFAGGTADAFTLFERFEAKLEKHQGNLLRSAVELAKGLAHRPHAAPARSDAGGVRRAEFADHLRQRRRARAGAGTRRDRQRRAVRAGRGARVARKYAAAAEEIVKKALTIAGDLCIYTNQQHMIEILE